MECLGGECGATQLNVFVFKEPDYNIVIMSTFLSLTVPEGQKEEIMTVIWDVIKFKYPEVVADNYGYRGHWKITIHCGMIVVLMTKLVLIIHGKPPGVPSKFFFCSVY